MLVSRMINRKMRNIKSLILFFLLFGGFQGISQIKMQKVEEVQTEDKTIKIGSTDKYIVYLDQHTNYTENDSTYSFNIEEIGKSLSHAYLFENDEVKALLNTLISLKEKLKEKKPHDTKVRIEGNYKVYADASYKVSSGKWESSLFLNDTYFFDVVISDINNLIPLIEKALSIMPEDTTIEIKSLEPFLAVEEMPQFISGDALRSEAAMVKYIAENTKYPKEAKTAGIEGSVRVKFIVSSDGTIKDAKIISKDILGAGCEEEAIRVIMSMPKWIPGRQNGQAVPVYFNLPVHFRLF